ncbi:MAG: hypothetical protein ACP5O1_11600, partial [Phycisphaerae bacterium]
MNKNRLSRGLIIAAIAAMGTIFGVHHCLALPGPHNAPPPSPQPVASVAPQLIIKDIRLGVSFLLSQEDPNILWEKTEFGKPYLNDIGGKTALATEALLDVEQTLHLKRLNIFKPAMRRAIEYLVTHHYPTTYYCSFAANALALLPHKSTYRRSLVLDGRFLLESIRPDGGYTYAWGPPAIKKYYARGLANQIWDNSNTQYGVLGVWACAHYGIGIPSRYWEVAASHWRRKQSLDGSWGYAYFRGSGFARRTPPARAPTFTPAGVASLLICDEFLGAKEGGGRLPPDPAVLRGLAWINKNFPATTNDQYEMYCYERVGLASGLVEFGGQNWYNTFAHTLTISYPPTPSGSWASHFISEEIGYGSNVIGTAYALLILDRGLNPIFMSKLEYGKNYFGRWNIYPRDV